MFVSRTLFDGVQRRIVESYPSRSLAWSRNVAALVVADLAADALRDRSDLARFVADLDTGVSAVVDLVRGYVARTATWLDEIDPRQRATASRSPVLRDVAVALGAVDEIGATLARIAAADSYSADAHESVAQCVCAAHEVARGLRDIEQRGAAELVRRALPRLTIVAPGDA